ncbi:MAG: hypothetical protein Q9168_007386 [Polycauliona sp. 1 TL-2023]
MLFPVALFYLLGLVASTAIPAAPAASPDSSLSLTNDDGVPVSWPFHRSVTQVVPNSDVRITLTGSYDSIGRTDLVKLLVDTGRQALDNSADQAGGYDKVVGQPYVRWSMYHLTINITDLTMKDPKPESGGGKLTWGELRFAWQGIGANIGKIKYDECKIDIWRMGMVGIPKRQAKIKHLGIGWLKITPNEPDSGKRPGVGFTVGNMTATE